jgi:hypothetical protein
MTDKVIVRTVNAGVHYGTLDSRDGGEVVLTGTRRMWYWDGAASLSQLARDGVSKPKTCKFSVTLDKITVLGAIEIIPCTEKAVACIEAVPEWTA